MSKLAISDELLLPLDAVTETFGILAVRGAGKSNSAAVMAEEMHAAHLPFVVVDPVGAWWGLRSSRDGKAGGLDVPLFGGRRGDVPLERGGGQLVADLIVDQRLSCVLDLTGFDSEASKKAFLLDFARRLYQRNEAPLHLFLEEADDYIPQRPMREEAQLLRAWENIVRRGRGRGLGVTLITQRSASINKNVLTQVQTLIAMRTTGPQDRAAIEDWLKYHNQGREILESLPSLRDGEAWIWSPEWLRKTIRVRFRLRHTFDSGATPKMRDAGRAPTTLAEVDLDGLRARMAATIERAKAEDPRELRRRIADLERQLTARPQAKAAPAQKVRTVEVPVLDEKMTARIERAVLAHAREWPKVLEASERVRAEVRRLQETIAAARRRPAPEPRKPISFPVQGRAAAARVPNPDAGNGAVPRPQQRIIDRLAWLEAIGVERPDRAMLALWCGVSPTSGGYFNSLGALRSAGLIDYPGPALISLTELGRQAAAPAEPMTVEQMHEALFRHVGESKARILRAVIAAYPQALQRGQLAEAIGVSPTSGGYFNNLGALRTLGVIDYPGPGQVAARPVLFLDR